MKKLVTGILTLALSLSITATAFAATPVYENGFDGSLGGAQTMTRPNPTPSMPVVDSSVTPQFKDGKNDKALYLDGTYGVLLDTEAVGDTYTLAFWVKPESLSIYGPIIQIGSDLLSENLSATWLNITKCPGDWGGEQSVIWSRNETTGAWPWYGAGYVIPLNEWTHIAVVVDGKTPGTEANTVASKLYINGELVRTGNVATGTFEGDAKAYVGINCWDALFKGYLDDIKIYNTVLTDDEIKTAMNEPVAAKAATSTSKATSSTPKTGVPAYELVYGLGAAVLGAGAVVLRKRCKR